MPDAWTVGTLSNPIRLNKSPVSFASDQKLCERRNSVNPGYIKGESKKCRSWGPEKR